MLLGVKRTRSERTEVDFGLDRRKQPTGVLVFCFCAGNRLTQTVCGSFETGVSCLIGRGGVLRAHSNGGFLVQSP